jgi:hypothetical protein
MTHDDIKTSAAKKVRRKNSQIFVHSKDPDQRHPNCKKCHRPMAKAFKN